jgi:hypothetical protein
MKINKISIATQIAGLSVGHAIYWGMVKNDWSAALGISIITAVIVVLANVIIARVGKGKSQ